MKLSSLGDSNSSLSHSSGAGGENGTAFEKWKVMYVLLLGRYQKASQPLRTGVCHAKALWLVPEEWCSPDHSLLLQIEIEVSGLRDRPLIKSLQVNFLPQKI